ncbi:hypothetical protein A203_21735 [Chromobacterium violaceum]
MSLCKPACRIRSTSVTASSECPPSSKKLSWRPTGSTPSSSRQIAASVVSASPSGAAYARLDSCEPSGAGSALRSSLPFGVNGKASSTTKPLGTMYSASSCDSAARNAAASSVAPGCAVK